MYDTYLLYTYYISLLVHYEQLYGTDADYRQTY